MIRVLTDIANSVLFFYAGVFLVRDGLANITSNFLKNFLLWLVINFLR